MQMSSLMHMCAYAISKCQKSKWEVYWIPFDGANAISRYCFEDWTASSNMLAVPDPTTPTLTDGVPAALSDKLE